MPDNRKYTEAQKKSAKKWDAANLDRISIAAPKGAKDRWKAVAATLDKSLNQFIVEAVNEKIDQESARVPTSAAEAGVESVPSKDGECAPAASDGRTEGIHREDGV